MTDHCGPIIAGLLFYGGEAAKTWDSHAQKVRESKKVRAKGESRRGSVRHGFTL